MGAFDGKAIAHLLPSCGTWFREQTVGRFMAKNIDGGSGCPTHGDLFVAIESRSS